MLQLNTFFCIHFSKAHNNFASFEFGIAQHTNIYPSILLAIPTLEVAAKVPDIFCNQSTNIVQREGLSKFIVGISCHVFQHFPQKVTILAFCRSVSSQMVAALHPHISTIVIIHPINCIIHVTQNTYYFIHRFYLLYHAFATPVHKNSKQYEHYQNCYIPEKQALVISQNIFVRNGNYRNPTIICLHIIHASLVTL